MPSPLLSDKDVGSLLAPVNMGSFVVSPMQGSRQSFSGIPKIDKSKMWDYAMTEDSDKRRILSFLLDNRAVNFRLEKPEKEGAPIKAKRLPDSESQDFGVGGNSTKGRAQIHKADSGKITGTFQTGKTNTTFDIAKASDNEEDWHIVPRKNPEHDVDTFVSSIMDTHKKKAFDLTSIQGLANQESQNLGSNLQGSNIPTVASGYEDKLKSIVPAPEKLLYPLGGTDDNGSMLKSVGIAGGIGAGVMGLRNIIQRLFGQNHNALASDMFLGGAGGAGISGLYHALGNTSGLSPQDRKIYANGWKPGVMPQIPSSYSKYPTTLDVVNAAPTPDKIGSDEEELTKSAIIRKEDGKWKLYTKDGKRVLGTHADAHGAYAQESAIEHSLKEKMEKEANQTVDLISLQGILGADPSLTPGDRNILLQQARTAMNSSGGQTSVSRIENLGLGMLSGYVLSKCMGFGGAGTIASMAIGGALGSSMGNNNSGPIWNNDGYMTY